MRDPKDTELLAQLQRGDEHALENLSAAYGSKIHQLAFRYLHNQEDAEEVTQDVLYKVHRSVGSFRGDAALSSWIYRITFNASMSRIRTASYQQAREEERAMRSTESQEGGAPSMREFADWSQMADEDVFRSEMRQEVFRAIGALPAIYRAPVVLRDVHGMSTEEASAVLHVKDQTLKSRLHRGRLLLRRQLANFAQGLALHRPIYGT